MTRLRDHEGFSIQGRRVVDRDAYEFCIVIPGGFIKRNYRFHDFTLALEGALDDLLPLIPPLQPKETPHADHDPR